MSERQEEEDTKDGVVPWRYLVARSIVHWTASHDGGSRAILILLAKSSNQRTDAAEGQDGGRISRRFRLVSDFASSIYLDAIKSLHRQSW